ncbi:MAG: glycosyltransferase family 2 protein [Nanoarchaeota archaeon]|nr:glycosyltransferase family 2 protein [Nanoarchaeota archaeon]MBU1029977.1 glycosyltransferase family 2 protein [Nanoarchaeota archaeon]MBU1849252.1 glycosyltransferase family 2 protein [Nanoarchaeota archaeon]
MKRLTVLIPAYNEEGQIENTINHVYKGLLKESIPHEILVVNDNSSDKTPLILKRLTKKIPTLRYITKGSPNGFGFAVRKGLEHFKGDYVVVMMADESDSVDDLVKYYRKLEEGFDCVFGSRFMRKSQITDYPKFKLVLNRMTNMFIKILFQFKLNDTTNAFKGYTREVIEGVKPILSLHFNLTVELPLKAIIRGFSYTVVPISWQNRKKGVSKLKLKEMGSRYLFIILYCFLEKLLSKGDYLKKQSF